MDQATIKKINKLFDRIIYVKGLKHSTESLLSALGFPEHITKWNILNITLSDKCDELLIKRIVGAIPSSTHLSTVEQINEPMNMTTTVSHEIRIIEDRSTYIISSYNTIPGIRITIPKYVLEDYKLINNLIEKDSIAVELTNDESTVDENKLFNTLKLNQYFMISRDVLLKIKKSQDELNLKILNGYISSFTNVRVVEIIEITEGKDCSSVEYEENGLIKTICVPNFIFDEVTLKEIYKETFRFHLKQCKSLALVSLFMSTNKEERNAVSKFIEAVTEVDVV